MILNFYFFVTIFVYFFLVEINCILNVNNFVNTAALGLTNISASLLAGNGQIAYIAFKNGSTYTINQYSISAGVPTYVNKFISTNNTVNADRLLIYKNTYLIAYQTNGNSFNVFYLSNYTFYGIYVMNESIYDLHYVPSKAIILYININGQLKYIQESNFLLSNTKVIINNNMSIYPSMSVSPDQNSVALASGSSQYVYVYSLTNYSVVTTFIFPFYATQYSLSGMVWRSNQDLVMFSEYNCIVYQLSIPSGSYNTSTALLVPTCSNVSYQTMFLVNLIYIQATDQIVGAATYVHTQPYSAFFSYSLSTLQITYFTNVSFIYPSSYSNSADNNLLFSNNNSTSLYFGNILPDCQNPYVYDPSIYQCTIIAIVNSTNSTNSSQLNLTSFYNNSNSTVFNSTNQTGIIYLNITNATNLTIFSNLTSIFNSSNITFLNSTNQTNLSTINTTNLTNTNNFTNFTEIVIGGQSNLMFSNFQKFINFTLKNQQLTYLNSIPGSRKYLQPFFTFFINFDDLWLYVYHQREYDIVVDYVFNSIQQLENQKWNFLPIRIIWQFLGLESNNTINQFSSKLTRTSQKFYSVQQNSNGFIVNTLTFFCSNVFLMFIIFVVLRILFNLLFNYRISILFRKYSFWLYFLIVMLQGNLQYLTYLFSFELQNFFSVNYINKFGLGFAVILFFCLFIFSVTVYPVVKYHHDKLIRYFVQNMKLSTFTAFYMAIHMGYRNVLLGFLHSILDNHYFIKIGSLIVIQVIFLLFTFILLSKKNFQNHLTVWINILASLLRICLIFTFFLDYQNIYINLEIVHIQIFYVYISEMFVAILIQTIIITIEIKNFFLNYRQKIQIDLNKDKNIFMSYTAQTKIEKKNQKKIKIVFVDQNGVIFDSLSNSIQHQLYNNQRSQNEKIKANIEIDSHIKKKTKILITKKYKMIQNSKSAKTNIIFNFDKQQQKTTKFINQDYNIKQIKLKLKLIKTNKFQQKGMKITKIHTQNIKNITSTIYDK